MAGRPANDSLGAAALATEVVDLLLAATAAPAEAAAAWRRWSERTDVDDVGARGFELLPAVSANLDATVLGDETERLRGLRRRNWALTQLRLKTARHACGVLDDAGIGVVLIKGANLATCPTADPGVRPMSDADLLVGPERFDDAVASLEAAGFRVDTPGAWERGPWSHATCLVDDHGQAIDLHRWAVFPRFARTPDTAWRERALPAGEFGPSVARLAPADECVLAILHGLLSVWPRTDRWPLDVERTLRWGAAHHGSAAAFWSAVERSATELGVGAIVGRGLDAATEVTGVDVPGQVRDRLGRGSLDPWLRLQWFLTRWGIRSSKKVRWFIDVERAAGRRPDPQAYARARAAGLGERGLWSVLAGRIGLLRRRFSRS